MISVRNLFTFFIVIALALGVFVSPIQAVGGSTPVRVSGMVWDGTTSGHTFPLYARLVFKTGSLPDVVAYTDPFTGSYSTTLYLAYNYQVTVSAVGKGYTPATNVAFTPSVSPAIFDQGLVASPDCTALGYDDNPLFTENFDGVHAPTLPPAWSDVDIVGTSGDWDVANLNDISLTAPSGVNVARFNSGSATAGDATLLILGTVFDLSTHSSAGLSFWMYHDNLSPTSDDKIQVYASTDGSVWHPVDPVVNRHTSQAPYWGVEKINLSSYTGPGKTTVHVAILGTSAYGKDIYLDNIKLGDWTCTTVAGGKVAGFVTNLQNRPIVQATVYPTARLPEGVLSATTPQDPKQPDGYYELFSSSTGSVQLAANTYLQRYDSTTATVTVASNGITRRDFTLSSARLAFNPTPLFQVVVGGGTAHQPLTISNSGAPQAGYWLDTTPVYWPPIVGQPVLDLAPEDVYPYNGIPSTDPADSASGSLGQAFMAQAESQSMAMMLGGSSYPTYYHSPIPSGGVYRSAVASCDGRTFYIMGGQRNTVLNETWAYDSWTDTWTQKANMPKALANMNAVCEGGIIFTIGGWDGVNYTNDMLMYSIYGNSWGLSTWPNERAPMLAAYQGMIYAFGGYPGPSKETWQLDPNTRIWTRLNDMPSADAFGAAVTVGNYIFIIGGADSSLVMRFDPNLNSWSSAGPQLPEFRMNPTAAWYGTTSMPNALYLFGGGGRQGSIWKAYSDGLAYDTSQWPNGSWGRTAVGTLSSPVVASAGICLGNKVWMAGGLDGATVKFVTNQVYSVGSVCRTSLDPTPWLIPSPANGIITGGGTSVPEMNFYGGQVSGPGYYRAIVRVSTDSPLNYEDIPVSMVRVDQFNATNLEVTPQADFKGGPKGGEVNYAVKVTNKGIGSQSFTMSLLQSEPAGWSVVITPNPTPAVPAGKSVTINVKVSLPTAIGAPHIYPVNLKVAIDGSHYVTATLVTTVYPFRVNLPALSK